MPPPAESPPLCSLRVLRHPHWTAVLIRGELDLESRRRLEGQLRTELVRGKPMIVELAGLDFSDANGLWSLQRIVEKGASLDPPVPVELHGARGQVARLLRVLGIASSSAGASSRRRDVAGRANHPGKQGQQPQHP